MKTQKVKNSTNSTVLSFIDDLQHNTLQIKNIFELIGILLTNMDNSIEKPEKVLEAMSYLGTLAELGGELTSKLDQEILKL